MQTRTHNWKVAAEESYLLGDNATERVLCAAVFFDV